MQAKEITTDVLAEIKNIGPNRAAELLNALNQQGVRDFKQLHQAAQEGRITDIKGFGEVSQENIKDYLEQNWNQLIGVETKEIRRSKPWKSPSFWVWLAMALGIVLAGTLTTLFRVGGLAAAGVLVITIVLGLIWFWKCWVQVGSERIPAQGVVTLFARPIDVVPMGRYFMFRPFEGVKEIPTGQYTMPFDGPDGVYTKQSEDGELESQPIRAKANLYTRFPRWDREYSYPMSRQEAERRGVELKPIESSYFEEYKQRPIEWGWGRISGKELLMNHTYPRLPIRDLRGEETVHKLAAFFEGGVLGAMRSIFQSSTSDEIKQDPPKIEDGIKTYLLIEEGNPGYECGLPKECLDVEVIMGKLPDDTEQAYKDVEIRAKEAQAAESEKEAIQRRLEAYREQGTPEEIAALIVGGGVEGAGMTLEQLRDLKILDLLGGFGGVSSKEEIGEEELVSRLKRLSTKELKELLNKIR